MNNYILITGATGFLGSRIAEAFIRDTNYDIAVLVRARNPADAAKRLSNVWWDTPLLKNSLGTRVTVLRGDVAFPGLGLDAVAWEDLAQRVTHIIHSAADIRLSLTADEIRKVNVQGTRNVLALARQAQRLHEFARFAHVSTAYVAGNREGPISEDSLSNALGFANAYELSKYEAEIVVKEAKEELPVSVFRPGLIVGDSNTGEIRTFNTLYYPLRLYLTGKLKVLLARPTIPVNLIPVDYVADAIVRLTFDPRAQGKNFHITAARDQLPSASEVFDAVRMWASENLHVELARPLFVPLPGFLAGILARAAGLSGVKVLLPYFQRSPVFLRSNTDELVGAYRLDWKKFLPRLLEYAAATGFLHKSERTVHEQILFRLNQKSRKVIYGDITGDSILRRSGGVARQEMIRAGRALGRSHRQEPSASRCITPARRMKSREVFPIAEPVLYSLASRNFSKAWRIGGTAELLCPSSHASCRCRNAEKS